MRICRFDSNNIGLIEGDNVVDVTAAVSIGTIAEWPLPRGDWFIANLEKFKAPMLEMAKSGKRQPLSSVKFLSPIANPNKIIAAPVNYLAHQTEVNSDKSVNFGTQVKTIESAGLFLKANSALVGPSEGIELRMPDRRHDHEGELVVVIGKKGREISEADALSYIAGYSLGLDMTARGPEERSLRKSMDTYAVVGGWLTTPDEVADPDNLELKLTLNGEVKQHSNTNRMIFSTRKLIAYASAFYTLYPGDIIFTGTPDGVSRVAPGDEIKLTIQSVGELTAKVLS